MSQETREGPWPTVREQMRPLGQLPTRNRILPTTTAVSMEADPSPGQVLNEYDPVRATEAEVPGKPCLR